MSKKVRKKKVKVRSRQSTQESTTIANNGNSNNNSLKSSSNCDSNKTTSNSNNNLNIGLENLSYADYVLLASLAAFSIGDDLNDNDLDLLIVFFSMMSSDLALIRTKRGVAQRNLAAKKALEQANQNGAEEAAVNSTIAGAEESLVGDLSRTKKVRTKKYIKKKRK
ncbi:hypothetical protein [Romboutsia lituseburensis]|uniref:Uncharacterized protein n=1 Tax=Romboutsia lituseburensis DSM 797 TaxID=1121325 RepID=A0A1G9KCZ1_9FIRM|nr:hypothetical protein [Romboutsia lituseburensis]CEH34862.1 Hypothetical protein RLITU_2280 [Romboutsia lituseburensis]SDL47611.1 hypothetical protein SAMN04515677_10299 [Romboutsia lituseburensis DSM 797]